MERVKKLRSFMTQNQVDIILIESEVNRFYFTDFRCCDGDLLVTEKDAVLIVDSRFFEVAKTVAKDCEVIQCNDRDKYINMFCKEKRKCKILTEATGISAKRFKELNYLTEQKLVEDDSLDRYIQKLRRKKDEKEIGYLRKAQQIADQTFIHMLEYIKPGITETEIKMELGIHMVKLGSENYGMNFLVASGENSAYAHGGGNNRRIQIGDLITMDFGGQIHGYSSDMTRTVAVGKVCEEQRKVYEIVKEAQNIAMEKIVPGIACREIDKLARNHIDQKGYGQYFGHGLGHSLGLEIHENPRCNESSEDKLEIGTMMTIEPGIYIPGKFGVRIEDMVIITQTGCDNLTNATHDLMII